MESNPAAFNAAITAAASIASCSAGYALHAYGGLVLIATISLALAFGALAGMANSNG
ncbi:hypothetical protein [Castellaniella sp. UC4442_H9]